MRCPRNINALDILAWRSRWFWSASISQSTKCGAH